MKDGFSYVYRITNLIEHKHYYGMRTTDDKSILPSDDLGIKYFSTSYNKNFINEQKENPTNFKYKIIKVCETVSEALELEIKLHERFDVANHKSFYNKANQRKNGFTQTRKPMSEETRQKLIDRGYPQEWKDKISEAKKGKIPRNYDNFILNAKGKKYIHNGECEKRVSIDELEIYLNDGWESGRYKELCPHCGKLADISNLKKYHLSKCKMYKGND